MGKFRSKLKGQTKGKRWPKGQSSNSNPDTRKYRDMAKSRFFQENLGSSSLTANALKKHDAMQSVTITPMDEDQNSSTTYTSYGTMKSFASEWTDCSNMSFDRFLKIFRADSALHKEMLAILAAVTEVIKDNGGTESPTEYYCSLMTTLEQIYNSEERKEEQVTAILSLLNMGIRGVPKNVLQQHFDDVATKTLHILNDYTNSVNNAVVKACLGILSTLLKSQEAALWSLDSTVQVFRALVNPFSIHSKPKWRKAAQQGVVAIVKFGSFPDGTGNIPGGKVAEFCEEILENCLGSGANTVPLSTLQTGQTTILHILGLMKETCTHFPKNHIKKCCELILQLITLNYPIVTSCSLQVLHSLFSSQTAVVPAKLNAQLITALYDYQPSSTDVQPTLAWLAVMQQAHTHLADVDVALACTVLPKIFGTVTQLWLSEKNEIMTAATYTLEYLLKDGLTSVCLNKDLVVQNKTKIMKCFDTITQGLGYQFHNVWHQVLHVIGVMFEVGGSNCADFFLGTLKSLAELRDSYKFSYNNELEHAVGAAVRYLGPEIVLGVIALKKPNGDLNMDRSWMLPVLKQNIKIASLDYFINGILPLALYCNRRTQQLAEANDGIGAHSSELLYLQLWNLLPCFCNNPTDIKTNFKNIAKIMGTAISTKKELRLPIMAAIRHLITSVKENENPEDLEEIARFDKNYLPILFNVYTTKPLGGEEEGQRLAALDTIKSYLTIARQELTTELMNNCLERLNSSSDDPEDVFIKESILDLLKVLVPYQQVDGVETLYEQCVKPLLDLKNRKEQKKAYRLFEEICSCKSMGCNEFIAKNRKELQKILVKSLDSTAISSRGARLRCLNYLVQMQPQLDHESKLIRSIIPESILSCKDINEKTRSIAFTLLNTIGECLMNHNQMEQFVGLIMAGFAGNPQMICCSVLGLASVLHHFTGALGQANINLILENVGLLSKSHTREVVGACLSFIKVYSTSMPSPVVGTSLPSIMKALTGMTDDCKRHYRLKVRDILDRLIRKYGCESLTPYVPSDDTVMYKRLRNLRKLNARKKRQKEVNKNSADGSDEEFLMKAKPKTVDEILADSDSDDDQEFKQTHTKKKPGTWIEEDGESIVDFTDPNVVKKITATKPESNTGKMMDKNPRKKERGFKTASDGRLIIADDSSDSDTDKKINLESDDTDEEEEAQNFMETVSNKKRKRGGSSVKSGLSSFSQTSSMRYRTGGTGIHRATSQTSIPGSEYRSKKAKGDVKKKGKCEPYAYLPLKRSLLNKRKKMKAAGSFKNIVKAAKSGALKGAKARKSMKK